MTNQNERDQQAALAAEAEEVDLLIEDLTSLVELNQDWGCCAGTIGCFLCVGGTVGTSGTFFCECL